jgi:hypothetical protein
LRLYMLEIPKLQGLLHVKPYENRGTNHSTLQKPNKVLGL